MLMQTKRSSASLGAILVVLSSITYASYGIWIKLDGTYFGDFTQGALRGLFVIAILIPLGIYLKRLSMIRLWRDRYAFIGLFIASMLISGPLFYAIKIIGVGLGIGITYVGIILGMFAFGRLIGGENYTRPKQISTAIGLIGLALIFVPGAKTFGLLGLFAALLSGLGAGLGMVVSKHLQYTSLQITILNWATATITNTALALFLNEAHPNISLNIHWLYIIIFAVASLTSSWLVIAGLKLIDAGTVGILGLLEIVFGVFFGVIFFNEHPSALTLVGMSLIVAAALVPYLNKHRTS